MILPRQPPANTNTADNTYADNRHLTIQEQFTKFTANNQEIKDSFEALRKYHGINTVDITYLNCVMHGPMVKKVEKEKLF